MADIYSRVRFLGDASQLLATYRAIGAAGQSLNRQIQAMDSAALRAKNITPLGSLAGIDKQPIGAYAKNIRTEFDAVNKVLTRTADTFLHVGQGAQLLTGELKEVFGNTDDVIKATSALSAAEQREASTHNTTSAAIQRETAALRALTQARTAEYKAALAQLRTQAASGRLRDSSGRFVSLKSQEKLLKDKFNADLASGAILQQQTKLTETHTKGLQANAEATRNVTKARNALNATLAAPVSRPPAGFEQIPPSALRNLQRLGLPSTPQGLFDRGATVDLTKDAIHGTTRANVAFRDQSGVLSRASIEWDKYNKVLTRFGGNLSGVHNLLDQTVRNLQKVIQWTIATSVVFGTLAFAAKELGTIVTLDKNLQQLSITAQATQAQTRDLFQGLAAVAFTTATPLAEIVKAADDIALAVRNSGSSVKEYQADILRLSEAVGIFTNLTGTDTVQATDLLTSTMKQLGIQTEDVVGILSKVTAVAGGQSTAIADITQVLAVMSEAARQAGLTIDQTIATAQVLSQVTAKSPAEIATAFKNLTGSLDSRAGTKALAEFGIALRDEAGNLRNILDIYGEISDKIRQGLIPAADVKGLVKAIAGGPRRVPDAAALLSNIDQIQSVTERSIDATNEALVANARILDTTAAKITKLQVTVDKFAFEKFGPALKTGIEFALTAATALVDVFNKLDGAFLAAAIQAGAFLLAIRLGAIIVSRAIGGLAGFGAGLIATGKAAQIAAKDLISYNTAASGQLTMFGGTGSRFGKLGLTKTFAASVAGSALVGGGLTSLSGGNPLQALGGALQGAGFAALAAPVPHPLVKVAGAASFAVGSLLQLVTATQQTNDALKETAIDAAKADQALSAFAAYKEARSTVEALSSTQKELSDSIERISGQTNKTQEDLALLADFQNQYVQNVLAMADANLKLEDSQKTLNETVPGFEQAIKAAKQGILSQDEINKFLRDYQEALLKITNPDIVLPKDVGIPTPQNIGFVPFEGPTKIPDRIESRVVPTGKQRSPEFISVGVVVSGLDLKELETDFTRVKELFKDGLLIKGIPETGQNIDLITSALIKLSESGDQAAPGLLKTFQAWVAGVDALKGAEVNLAIFQSRITALANIDPSAAGNLQKVLDLTTKIVRQAGQVGGPEGAKAIFESTTFLADALKAPEDFDIKTTKGLAEIYAKLVGLDTSAISLRGILDSVGLSFVEVGAKGQESLIVISEEADALLEKFKELRDSTLGDIASKSADLQARQQGGEIIDPAQLVQLQALEDQIIRITSALENAELQAPDELTAVMEEFASSLTTINGLQDAESLTIDQLIGRLFSLAETYGLTGQEVVKLGDKIAGLFDAINTISRIKAQFNIKGNLDLSAVIKQLQAMKAAIQRFAQIPVIGDVISGQSTKAIDDAISMLQGAGSVISGTGISSIYSGGAGSSFAGGGTGGGGAGGAAKTAAGPDVSTVDIPDAIANAYNRDALIQEAIRRAKALQAKIPGAAADAKNDIVELLKGTQHILEVRGVKDDLLRRALEELAEIEKKRLEFETKADTIRRIRVGSGSFAAIANVPVNSRTGVSLGGAEGPINISLNLNGTVLTPAQLAQFADLVAAALKRQIANG